MILKLNMNKIIVGSKEVENKSIPENRVKKNDIPLRNIVFSQFRLGWTKIIIILVQPLDVFVLTK